MHACKFMTGWGVPRCAAALSCVAGFSLALSACDLQASPEFRGESLLTVHGSVTIAEDHTRGQLVPALAFANRETGEIQVLDVQAQGEFPSDFRIDVFTPPSPQTLTQLTDFGDDEPRMAFGYITAVTEDHPHSFFFATNEIEEVRPSGCNGCELECDPVRGCAETHKWCSDEQATHCYSETTICPEPESALEDCRVERDGDPTLKQPAWRFFAGFSQNYAVAYLMDPAPAGSGTAAYLGASGGLSRGYQLLRVLEPNAELQTQYEECSARADQSALEAYNRDHDTEYGAEDVDDWACLTSVPCLDDTPDCSDVPAPPARPVCALAPGERDELIETLRIAGQRARVDLGCLLSPLVPVENADDVKISIVIGSNVQPGF
jgi:hypothetical protein